VPKNTEEYHDKLLHRRMTTKKSQTRSSRRGSAST